MDNSKNNFNNDEFKELSDRNLGWLKIVADAIKEKLEIVTKEDDLYGVVIDLSDLGIDRSMASNIFGYLNNNFDFLSKDPVSPLAFKSWLEEGKVYFPIQNIDGFKSFHRTLAELIRSRIEAKFDEENGLIIFNKKRIKLTKYRGRYYFCKKMFSYPINIEVSWDELYDAMQSTKIVGHPEAKQQRKTVSDTMRVINHEVEKEFKKSELFKEENGMY